MPKKISKSFLEGDLAEKTEEELKERILKLYQTQRDLKDLRQNDIQIKAHTDYIKETYSLPNSDIESEIKVLRRVFRLRGIRFDCFESPVEKIRRDFSGRGVTVSIVQGDNE